MNNSQEVYQGINRESVDPNVVKEGGSVLGVLEDMIHVGQAMGSWSQDEKGVDKGVIIVRKRLCIKTKQPVSILESFKIIFKGKVLLVRVKELFTWNLTFLAHKEMVYASKDKSVHSLKKIPAHSPFSKEVSGDDSESDVEEVSKTIFGDNSSSPNNNSDEMETLDIEDNFDLSFGRKRLCIKTKQSVSILESFKIIFKGKVLLVRAKELFTWNATFLAHKEMVYASKDESVHSLKKIPAHSSFSEEVPGDDSESDVEEVSKTIFGDNSSSPNNNSDEMGKQHSKDPFKIYDILKKQTGGETREVSSYLSYPPGFTSEVSEIQKENDQGAEKFSSLVNGKVMNNSQEVYQEINRESVDPNVVKEVGSILGVLEDMNQVGQAIGYKMDGCVKDFERIIGTQGADDVPR
uniref:RNA-directed DNA polymerase, eukaryota n=1 Tax=Tanacetum cinerariifolium TaxID=118510 RepID=A0A6L2MQW4_TANCI|nr:hypothetical protein [Tanacetum cinerariifolium]